MMNRMSLPLVTIVTPVHNGEKFIKDCIESVRALKVNHKLRIEHIIVDDGSTDSTVEKIEPFLKNYIGGVYTTLIKLPHCGVLSQVRNEGVTAAKGKYIFQLDVSDIILQYAVLNLVEHMEQTGAKIAFSSGLCVSDIMQYQPELNVTSPEFSDASALVMQTLYSTHFWLHASMITKDWIDSLGGYDPVLVSNEETDLILRSVFAGEVPSMAPTTSILKRTHGITDFYDKKIQARRISTLYFKFEKELQELLSTRQYYELRHYMQENISNKNYSTRSTRWI